MELTFVFPGEFVEDHERCYELAIHVLGRAVGLSHSFGGDDDWANQTGVGLRTLIDVRVIPPHDRTQLTGARSATGVSEPVVGKIPIRRKPGTTAPRQVERAFTVFVVAQPVRVDVGGSAATIQEMHYDLVAYLGANNGSQNSKPLGLRFGLGECVIAVLDVTGFLPLRVPGPRRGNGTTAEQVSTTRSVIPGDILGCNVVVAGGGEGEGRNRDKHKEQAENSDHCRIIRDP